MAKITISQATARRIVEVGTESVYSNVQRLKKPERTGQMIQQTGHLIGTLLNDPSITGPYSGGRISMDDIKDSNGNNEIWTGIKCPLLRQNATISKNSKVVLSRNLATGEWQIIEAQCPAASAAPLPSEGEEEGESGENNSGENGSSESGESNTNNESNQEEGQTEGSGGE